MSILDELMTDENLKLKPYKDTKGKLTIGIGRNLDDVGISKEEAIFMAQNDIAAARRECAKYDWFSLLDQVRQDVVIEMMFNLGAPVFSEFKQLMAALSKKDFNSAASEMMASHWAGEVGKRAVRLAEVMKSGVDGSVAQG